MMRKMTEWLREAYPDVYIISGNVATSAGVRDLVKWGADFVKVGIAGGAVCLTKNITGVLVPQFSAIIDCSKVVPDYELKTYNGFRPLIIADGGIAEIGDKKVYRGMASRDAMLTIRSADKLPTAEGLSTLIDATDVSASTVLEHIDGGLRSSFSYSNSRTIAEYHENVEFGVRLNKPA